MVPLHVIAEPRRQEILRLVWEDEASAGEIAGQFDISFPAVSQHLAVLRDAGFVKVRRDGTRRLYLADRERLGDLADVLQRMWTRNLDQLATLAEEAEASGG